MKRALICHHVEWDKAGNIRRRMFREAGPADQAAPPPAPAPPVRTVRRGSVAQEQDRLI